MTSNDSGAPSPRGSLAKRTSIVLIAVASVAMALSGYLGYETARQALEQEAFNKLRAVREIKRNQLVSLFSRFEAELDVLRNDPKVTESMKAFRDLYRTEGEIGTDAWKVEAARIDGLLQSVVTEFGWYDVFLIDPDGNILFTVVREPDLGMNIPRSELSESSMGEAFEMAQDLLASPRMFDSRETAFADFAPYGPSAGAPASFFMSPIRSDDELVGFFAFQIPLDEINRIMQERSGLGRTGETYLVGPDGRMRSDSFLDRENRSVVVSFRGSVEENGVETEATREAHAGHGGERIIADYRGVPVLSAYTFLDLYGVRWALMAEIDRDEAFEQVTNLRRTVAILLVVLVPFVILVSVAFARTITRPLAELAASSELMGKQDLSHSTGQVFAAQLFKVASRSDEVGELASTLIRMESRLLDSVEKLKSTMSAKQRMEGELNIGREIQMSMLPLTFPAFPERREFSIFAELIPAREVGGDFYDFFFIDDHRFCFAVGDVSGKGVPSALFMAVTKTLVDSRGKNDPSPASIVTHVNDELSHNNPTAMFVTLFIGVLDLRNGDLVYTNAGHNPPYVVRKDGSTERLDTKHGPILGAMPALSYGEDRVRIGTGDAIFTYTDGVTEAMNPLDEQFTEASMVELLSTMDSQDPETILGRVLAEVETFRADAVQSDDITMLAIRLDEVSGANLLEELRLLLGNRAEEILRANESFNEMAKRHEMPDKIRRQMNMVLDELLNNVISYAWPEEGDHEMRLDVELYSDRITVTLMDDGRPFNPLTQESPDTEARVQEREIGGLGIHLVKGVMDDVNYRRDVDRNVLTLVKLFGEDV